MNVRSTAVALVMSVLVTLSSIPLADAQMGTLANPLPTTLVLVSPMPGESFGDRMVITFGVGRRKYKFLVADAYVDDPVQLAHFTDVWEYVRTHQPNFVVQGPQSGVFDKIQPGQTVTIRAMFAALDRTLEVMSSEVGRPSFTQPQPKTY